MEIVYDAPWDVSVSVASEISQDKTKEREKTEREIAYDATRDKTKEREKTTRTTTRQKREREKEELEDSGESKSYSLVHGAAHKDANKAHENDEEKESGESKSYSFSHNINEGNSHDGITLKEILRMKEILRRNEDDSITESESGATFPIATYLPDEREMFYFFSQSALTFGYY